MRTKSRDDDNQDSTSMSGPDVCDGIDLKWMNEPEDEEEDDWYRTEQKKKYRKSGLADEPHHGSAPVKDLTHEVSCRGRLRRMITKNYKARLTGTFFDIIVKIIVCLLYFIRTQLDDPQLYACRGEACVNGTTPDAFVEGHDENDGMVFSTAAINWHVLLWIHRPLALWIVEVVLSLATFSKALLLILIAKGNRLEYFGHSKFILEFVSSVPFIVTLCYPTLLQDLYVPSFMSCWLAKIALEKFFHDLHLTKQRFQDISVTLSQQLFILVVTLCCLTFTTICGIQHIMRGSHKKPLTMFESFYFTVVTFSTVGYGDISPDIWLGQLFMVLMICIAFAFIPRQVEVIGTTWVERQKAGGIYGWRQARGNKHVVVCCRHFTAEATMNFLTEFYAHPKLEDHIVILLGSSELGSNMQMIIRDPKWTHRVIYMRGSALKDIDLKRCRVNQAEACFILPPGTCKDKEQDDKHTILRSWAVKDFAPKVQQYIQLFRVESKMHVKFAEHVVCEDEFKYALLANNCLYPGLSTLVSLLMHTSTGYEGSLAPETWQQIYGQHSGNEIYHIQLEKSMFFEQYNGWKFSTASADAHKRYGVTLVGILDADAVGEYHLQLNPGPEYILKRKDYCFYMSVTKEEYSKINTQIDTQREKTKQEKHYVEIAMELQKFIDTHEDEETDGEESVFNTLTSQAGIDLAKRLQLPDDSIHTTDEEILRHNHSDITDATTNAKVLQMYSDMGQGEYLRPPKLYGSPKKEFITGPPPVTLYADTKKTVCHLVRTRRENCCLQWAQNCEHCTYKNSDDDRWGNQLIILAAEKCNHGIYNFIVPLRSQFIGMKSLSPVIIMVEEEPDPLFLETISHFPMVYWMKGSLSSVDDLLKAGVHKSSHLVVVNRESNMDSEEILADSETIVAVQTVFKLFPNANVITELSQASNMRFMHFQAHDKQAQKISKLEKKLKENMRTSLTHIFRLPFAAGQVFSGSMLDTLLYQTFVKGYLIKFVRLLLGVDAEQNSGHLSSIKVKKIILAKYRTYGDLYQGLCSVTGEVPIAIYRTEKRKPSVSAFPSNNNVGDENVRKNKKTSLNLKQFYEMADKNDVSDLIKSRMMSLQMDAFSYCPVKEEDMDNPISYVILNPHPQRKLRKGDLVYVIQPSSMFAVPSRINRKNQRRKSWSNFLEKSVEDPHHEERPEQVSRSHSLQEMPPDITDGTQPLLKPPEEMDIPQIIVTKAKTKTFTTEKVKEC